MSIRELLDPGPYEESPGEAYMSAPMRAHFAGVLYGRQRALTAELDQTLDLTNSEQEERALALGDRDLKHELLEKIDRSLRRLESGRYGWCESCGAEIGLRRLEARPADNLCPDCQTLTDTQKTQADGV